MPKVIQYGIELFGRDSGASRAVRGVRRELARLGKTAKGLAFGREGIGGALGRLGLGGLVSGGLFAPVIGAAKLAARGVIGVVKGAVSTAVSAVRMGVKLATGLVRGVLGTLKKVTLVAGGVTAAATAFGVKVAADVEDAWSKVRTLVGDRAEALMGELRDLAVRTGKDLTEVIGGYYQVLSAGFSKPREALAFLRATLEGSIAGWTEFPTVVTAVSRTMRNFRLEVDRTREVMDKMLRTVDVGQIQLPELASVIGPLANAAASARASLDEMLASLGILAQTGPVEIVATQLRAFMLTLAQSDPDALQRNGGLVGYLRTLQGMSVPDLAKLFPERRALLGVQSLIRLLPQLEQAIADVGDSAGKTASSFEERTSTLKARWAQTWQAIRDIALSYGKAIAEELGLTLEPLPDLILRLRPAAERAGEAVAGLVGRLRELATGREWSFTNLRAGLEEVMQVARDYAGRLQALLAFQDTEGGWHAGPLIEALVAAFEVVAARVQGIFRALWITIGEDLTTTLLGAVSGVARQISEALMTRQEQAAADWWDERWRLGKLPQWAGGVGGKPFDQLPRGDRERVISEWGDWHPVQSAMHQAAMGLGGIMQDMASGRGRMTPDQQAEAAAEARAEAEARSAAASERMARMLEIAGDLTGGLGGRLRGAAETALPPKAPAAAAGASGRELPPGAQRLQGRIEELRSVEAMLARQGYGEQAEAVDRQIQRLLEKLDAMLRNVVDVEERHQARLDRLEGMLARHDQRITRLARARA